MDRDAHSPIGIHQADCEAATLPFMHSCNAIVSRTTAALDAMHGGGGGSGSGAIPYKRTRTSSSPKQPHSGWLSPGPGSVQHEHEHRWTGTEAVLAIFCPLKKLGRVTQKAAEKYRGNYAQVGDICRQVETHRSRRNSRGDAQRSTQLNLRERMLLGRHRCAPPLTC